MIRGLDTSVKRLRKQVFTEIARIAFESENVNDDIEAIPYKITPGDVPQYRESIWRERAIASERVRLAMGMSLRPEDKPVHITAGVNESNISEKYYEPPLMQVIPSACDRCAENRYTVSDNCRGCVAHPCVEVCPKGAISLKNGRSHIDSEKCIKCGKCKSACPYDAITHLTRPCVDSCGAHAITSDSLGRAHIEPDKCVSCGMCMVNCPFGAIADKSQIFQLCRALKEGKEIIAEVAPAIAGQFGDVPLKVVKAALLDLGFSNVYEVALGADVGAVTEAHHYVEAVVNGDLPFMLTSCCPSWAMLAKNFFPEMIDKISSSLTPMVATSRTIKKEHPDAHVVFIGPCAAKKLEASRHSVRSDVDFVITFEELSAIFEAKGIHMDSYDKESSIHDATGAGRGYGVAGGVIDAITKCVHEYYPGVEIKTDRADGLEECRRLLFQAKAGRKDGFLLEGMGCPGGCVAGAGTICPIPKSTAAVKKVVAASSKPIPGKELEKIELN
jgi:[FeFe] hydrogenase (group B1/B3)